MFFAYLNATESPLNRTHHQHVRHPQTGEAISQKHLEGLTYEQSLKFIEQHIKRTVDTLKSSSITPNPERSSPRESRKAKKVLSAIFDPSVDLSDQPELKTSVDGLREWHSSTEQQRRSFSHEQMVFFSKSFQTLASAANAFHSPTLRLVAAAGYGALQVSNAIASLATAKTALSFANPVLAIANAFFSVFGLFGSDHMKEYAEMIIREVHMVSQQVDFLNKDMRDHFKHTYKMLNEMMNFMVSHYRVSLATYDQIVELKQSLDSYQVVMEYLLDKTLLQDLQRTLYKICNNNDVYFRNLGQKGFQDIFTDLMFWLETYCCDPAFNGYVYCLENPHSDKGQINANQIIKALKDPLFSDYNKSIDTLKIPALHRIGYIAHCLGLEHAKSMLNPLLFKDVIRGLNILIRRGLPYYEIPMDNFPQKIDLIVAKSGYTLAFLDSLRSFDYAPLLKKYHEAAKGFESVLTNWIDQELPKHVRPIYRKVEWTESVELFPLARIMHGCRTVYKNVTEYRYDVIQCPGCPEPELYPYAGKYDVGPDGYYTRRYLLSEKARKIAYSGGPFPWPGILPQGNFDNHDGNLCFRRRAWEARKELIDPGKPYIGAFEKCSEQIQIHWLLLYSISNLMQFTLLPNSSRPTTISPIKTYLVLGDHYLLSGDDLIKALHYFCNNARIGNNLDPSLYFSLLDGRIKDVYGPVYRSDIGDVQKMVSKPIENLLTLKETVEQMVWEKEKSTPYEDDDAREQQKEDYVKSRTDTKFSDAPSYKKLSAQSEQDAIEYQISAYLTVEERQTIKGTEFAKTFGGHYKKVISSIRNNNCLLESIFRQDLDLGKIIFGPNFSAKTPIDRQVLVRFLLNQLNAERRINPIREQLAHAIFEEVLPQKIEGRITVQSILDYFKQTYNEQYGDKDYAFILNEIFDTAQSGYLDYSNALIISIFSRRPIVVINPRLDAGHHGVALKAGLTYEGINGEPLDLEDPIVVLYNGYNHFDQLRKIPEEDEEGSVRVEEADENSESAEDGGDEEHGDEDASDERDGEAEDDAGEEDASDEYETAEAQELAIQDVAIKAGQAFIFNSIISSFEEMRKIEEIELLKAHYKYAFGGMFKGEIPALFQARFINGIHTVLDEVIDLLYENHHDEMATLLRKQGKSAIKKMMDPGHHLFAPLRFKQLGGN